MKIEIKNIKQSLNKAHLSQNLFVDEINLFNNNYSELLKSINPTDSEETLKDYINDFLKNTYYRGKFTIKENVNNIDLVILNGNKLDDKIGVIIETKAIKNIGEMIATNDLNRKAFHEIIQYYMEERIVNKNLEIKHLIITNTIEWFIFDAAEFERIFYLNKKFLNSYNDWLNGKLVSKNKDWFYSELAKSYIENSNETIICTHFSLPPNLADFKNLPDLNRYKIFSPEHLLKLPFQNDSNTLNTEFYNELLHILGLHEIKIKNVKRIERLPLKQRHTGSFIENTINILQSDEILFTIDDTKLYGDTTDEQLFSIGLELCIIWLNRILFLKLLENQLVKYNQSNKEYEFLNSTKIQDFEQLRELFFDVLAVKPNERTNALQEKYPYIPYLNSSLFEQSEIERETIKINQLKSHLKISVFGTTVLKNKNGKRVNGTQNILEYLFNFLDSYNFASDHKAEIQQTNKTIINSAVLGLIFEKINGYKDGSHFTPGFITMYMSHEILRKAVIQKFNSYNFDKVLNYVKVNTITDLYNQIHKIGIAKANEIFNTLKVCDPSVGSGHFLVSALNELIAIKSELGILADKNGKILRDVNIEVLNDELYISIEGEFFTYNYKNTESQRIQETLFHEKQTIIENCLFGVDINSKSVNISRLRLWIELLKNTYYKTTLTKFQTLSKLELQTLPNIDINIKTGNSLISHFSLNGNGNGNGKLQSMKNYTHKYKELVSLYKNETNRNAKREFENQIKKQKENFARTVNPSDEDLRKIRKLTAEMLATPMFFSRDDQIQWQLKFKELETELQELQNRYDEKLKTVYNHAFEWRFEFPEVLDDNGQFIGFDVIIGNPPYIKEMNAKKIFMPLRKSGLWYEYIEGKMDLWYFFLHKAFELTSENGLISYITNSYWVKSRGSRKLIKRIYQNKSLCEIVNLNDIPIFEKVVGKHMIHSYKKNNSTQIVKYRNIKNHTQIETIENVPFTNIKFSNIVKETYIT